MVPWNSSKTRHVSGVYPTADTCGPFVDHQVIDTYAAYDYFSLHFCQRCLLTLPL